MPYWLKCALVVIAIILAIRFYNQFVDYIKRKGVAEYKNSKAIGRFMSNTEQMHRVKRYELLYRAREFFLIPGVIRKRTGIGAGDDHS